MAIDWAAVDWLNIGLLSAFVFLAALIGNALSFRSRLAAGILTALLFAAIYIFWTYYLHGTVPVPPVKAS